MESSVQSETQPTEGLHRSSNGSPFTDRLGTIRQEMEYLNTIGKRFVAAFDRFQVHRALLAALQELYSFSACCILLKGEPFELFIIPCYPLRGAFLQAMIQRIINASRVMDFPPLTAAQLAQTAYLDAPDDLAVPRKREEGLGDEIRSSLSIPLTSKDRII